MARTVGDLTRPLHRTISADEGAAVRRTIRRRRLVAWGTTLKQYLSLAAIISAVIAVDIWTRDTPRWGVAIGVEATLAGLFAIIVAVQARRLLALGTVETLPVHHAVVAIDEGYAQPHSEEAFRSENLSAGNYLLHRSEGYGRLDRDHLWNSNWSALAAAALNSTSSWPPDGCGRPPTRNARP